MSDDMNDDPLKSLGKLKAPTPSEAARQRAMSAGMAAFEANKTRDIKKSAASAQGTGWSQRLTSIIASLKGNWIMDMRLPIGTAAIALLVLPLGYQLYNSTALTPTANAPVTQVAAQPVDVAVAQPQPQPEVLAQPQPEPQTEVLVQAPPEPRPELKPEVQAQQQPEAQPVQRAEVHPTPIIPAEPAPPMMAETPAPMQDSLAQDADAAAPEQEAASTLGGALETRKMNAPATSAMMQGDAAFAPSPAPMPMPSIVAQPTAPSGDQFTSFDESRLKAVADEPVSTFSIDVDTASYSYVRRMIDDGYLPEPDAVRIEEMINYFPYGYEGPTSADVPFKPTMAVYPTPWNKKTQLLHIGIKGYVPPAGADSASNLVFLIDTSGSMDEPDKLPLLKRAFGLLVDQLSANDTVSIVVYAGSAGVVLEPTVATDKAKILGALDNLAAGGSTAGAEGIELAYRLAEQARIEGGTNRVILATDGDFNVGISDPDQLEDFIKEKRDSGVTLSVLGFGRGNLDDATMQALAQNGNGNASYISNFREAQKVLVEEGGSTLEMIAKDVKIQVEFNPAVVSEYRLIGYETRALNREDFNNDAVDAGDIGAGHTVTAIYEITPVGSGGQIDPLRYGNGATTAAPSGGDEIAFLKMRYKLPNEDVSRLIEMPVTPDLVYGDIADVSDDMRFAAAVAAFGQKLKGSNYGAISWGDIMGLAQSGRGTDESGYRAEFMGMVKTASLLKPDVQTPCPEGVLCR